MKQVTILPHESHVYVDGICQTVDLSGLDPAIHAVQWSEINQSGEIEFVNDPYGPRDRYRPNEAITSMVTYQKYVDAWNLAGRGSAPALV
jgi:hypothetical protein